jgi:glycosyltransferase involved in cell wall biosynthesis
VFFYTRNSARELGVRVAALREIAGSVEAFPIPEQFSRLRKLADHLWSVLSRRVYTVSMYRSAPVRGRLLELLKTGDFQLAHVDSMDLSYYLPALGDVRTICAHHNVESVLLRRRADSRRRGAVAAYMGLQAKLMEREEHRWCGQVDLNVTVSEADKSLVVGIAPHARVAVVPNGVDVTTYAPGVAEPRGIVFVGGLDWFPNRDALEFFAGEVLPRLRRLGAADTVTWVGRASPSMRRRFEPRGIALTGHVKDIRPYVHGAACFIVPLRVGGGTRLKILDAWAMGKAVVSTSIGCEGLEAVDGQNILIRNDAKSFADAVQVVLSNAQERAALGANARLTAERKYSWDVIGAAMRDAYEAVRIDGPSHKRTP